MRQVPVPLFHLGDQSVIDILDLRGTKHYVIGTSSSKRKRLVLFENNLAHNVMKDF